MNEKKSFVSVSTVRTASWFISRQFHSLTRHCTVQKCQFISVSIPWLRLSQTWITHESIYLKMLHLDSFSFHFLALVHHLVCSSMCLCTSSEWIYVYYVYFQFRLSYCYNIYLNCCWKWKSNLVKNMRWDRVIEFLHGWDWVTHSHMPVSRAPKIMGINDKISWMHCYRCKFYSVATAYTRTQVRVTTRSSSKSESERSAFAYEHFTLHTFKIP